MKRRFKCQKNVGRISRSLSGSLSLLLGTIVLGGLHLLGKLAHHILVDDRVQVATQHVNQPPVPDVQSPGQRAADLHRNHAVAGIQQTGPELGNKDDAGTEKIIQNVYK